MTYAVRLVPAADADIDLEVDYYESEEDGLGLEFLSEVDRAIGRVREFPEKHREDVEDIRVAILRRFPFGVFFIIEGAAVVVLGVLDLRADPAARHDRLRTRR